MAAQAVRDWADGAVPDLRAYDARLRAALGPAFSQLGEIARAVELSPTAVLLALRTSATAREVAVDAVVPVLGVALAAAVFGERLGAAELVGLAAAVAAAGIAMRVR